MNCGNPLAHLTLNAIVPVLDINQIALFVHVVRGGSFAVAELDPDVVALRRPIPRHCLVRC
jgi:hypothetical protein